MTISSYSINLVIPCFCSTTHPFQDFNVPNVGLREWAYSYPSVSTVSTLVIILFRAFTLAMLPCRFPFLLHIPTLLHFCQILTLSLKFLLRIRIDISQRIVYIIRKSVNDWFDFLSTSYYNYFDSMYTRIINDIYTDQIMCLFHVVWSVRSLLTFYLLMLQLSAYLIVGWIVRENTLHK